MQNGEAGSDQLPLLEGLDVSVQDPKASVTQSLPWVPGPRMVFGIVDAIRAREYNQDFRPLVEFLGHRCFLSVAFICCVLVVSVFIVLETGLMRPGKWDRA